MSAASQDPNIGRVIAEKYRLVEVLGAGGAGTVYRAVQLGLERAVALKILNPQLVSNPTAQARFRREARAASRLEHPNSVRVYDYGVEPDGTTYLTMELVEGRELFKVIYEDWPHPTARIVDIMSQVLSVLSTAHEAGIVHRDLKPENILLLQRALADGRVHETVKVTDFGIAKTFAEMGEESMKLTQAGTVHGTPEYMAPEQARGDEVDARADIYSCGVILYELMTGTLPFTSDNVFEVIMQQISREVEPPTRRRPSADRRLEPIVMRAMAKQREGRFASATEMREALVAAARQQPLDEGIATLSDDPSFDGRAFAATINVTSPMTASEEVVSLTKRRHSRAVATGEAQAYAARQGSDGIAIGDAPTGEALAARESAVPIAPAAATTRVKTEVVTATEPTAKHAALRVVNTGVDEPVDARSIGVGRPPYGLIALILLAVGGGLFAVARFVLQNAASTDTVVTAVATDASDALDAVADAAIDAHATRDAATTDARATRPPTKTGTTRRRPR